MEDQRTDALLWIALDMYDIERLTDQFKTITPATSQLWHLESVVDDRLFLSRTPSGNNALFLVGARESFGTLPKLPGIDHATVTTVPAGEEMEALRVTSSSSLHGNRILAHVAYELARRLQDQPRISNGELVQKTIWVFSLLGSTDEQFLPREKQRGLAGECLVLRQMLLRARDLDKPADTVLSRWFGYAPAKRDFVAKGIAIEVKTTAANTRLHEITSISQLDPQEAGEEVFVYSLGLKQDVSAIKKLPAFVDDVFVLLTDPQGGPDEEARMRFAAQLLSYGYNVGDVGYYEGEPGFLGVHLPAEMFAEATLDRLRITSFKNDALPTMVGAVSYTLNVTCEPISPSAMRRALETLLSSAPVS